MKRSLTLCFCLSMVFCTAIAYSQRLESPISVVRPDFSGEWKLNLQKSRWAHDKQPVDLSELTWSMTIEQKLPAIFMTTSSQRGVPDNENFSRGKYTLYPDGRGDIRDGPILTSTTEWKDNKLATTYYVPTWDRKTMVAFVEEMELSGDGNTLIVTGKHTEKICGVNVGVIDEAHVEKTVFDRNR